MRASVPTNQPQRCLSDAQRIVILQPMLTVYALTVDIDPGTVRQGLHQQ